MSDDVSESKKMAPSRLALPLRMVGAHVSELYNRKYDTPENDKIIRQRIKFGWKRLLLTPKRKLFNSYFSGIFCWLVMGILIVLTVDILFWIWVWHLSPSEFQNFTACIDAGIVPSWWERTIYHVACFWGSL